ncbi:MAG TPA: hypothetical protein VK524_31310 [Polyangiaceae bacterium]|nr:hypothetical protein [Polyangiaceae bacterium]
MKRLFRYRVWAALLLAALPACNSKSKPAIDSAAGTAGAASSTPSAASARFAPPGAPPHAHALAPQAARGCRIIALEGEIELGGGKLKQGSWVDGQSFMTLSDAARVVVKHPSSARELTVTGPARVRLCAQGEEEVVLSKGTLRTTAGPGARPGAQVLVFTPLGWLRYGDADLEARVTERTVQVQVRAGDAWMEPAFGATRQGPDHVRPRAKAALRLGRVATPQAAVTACQEAAQAAARAAEIVLAAGQSPASLGQRAADQLRARQTARALCGSALAVLGNARDATPAKDLEERLKEADALWQKVPSGRPRSP